MIADIMTYEELRRSRSLPARRRDGTKQSVYYRQVQPNPILKQFVRCHWAVRAESRTLPTLDHGVIPGGYVATYRASDDVKGRGLKRIGEPVARIGYYKGELEGKTFYFTFWLTREGKVAYLRFNPE